jgi:hypothetical protein
MIKQVTVFVFSLMLLLGNLNIYGQHGLSFDGVNDYVLTNQPAITGSAARTVEAWINVASTVGTTQQIIVEMGNTTPNGSRFTFNIINGNNLRIEIAGNGFNTISDVTDGMWHHVAVTYNPANTAGTKAKLYVDGVMQAQNDFTVALNVATPNIKIGVRGDGVNFFNGKMDEVRIWNVERTAAQILADKNKQYCNIPAGLIAYYTFDEGIAGGNNAGLTTVANLANGAFSGTLTNFALTGTMSNFVTGATLTASGAATSTINPFSCGAYTSPANHVYSTTGTYNDTILSSSGCDSIITINLTIGAAPVTNLNASAITSSGATITWTAPSGSAGYEYVIDQNSGAPPGSGTAHASTSYNATGLNSSSNYFAHVRSTCGGNWSSWSTVSFSTLCNAPAVVSKKDSFNCGPGTVTLEATASNGASLKWYNAAAGGTNIGTGNSFVTPSLTTTTNFYAEAVRLSPLGQIGRNDYTGIAQVAPNNTGQGIRFNALANINLDSVSVWVVDDAGSIIVQLQNAANAVLRTDTFTFSGTGATATSRVKIYLPVDYSIPTGNDYKILALNGTTVSLSREQNINPTFSNYSIANVVTMVSSWVNGATNAANYYYFYNFYVSSGCVSPRQAVVAAIRPIPTVNLGNDTTLCPGISLTLNAGNAGGTYLWSPGGQTTQTITTNAVGQYIANVTVNACSKKDTIVITPGVAPVNNLSDTTNLCEGDETTLNAGNTGSTFVWMPGGATTQTISVNSGGTNSVEIKSVHNCKLTSSSYVKMRPLPVDNLGNDTAICESATIVLDAGNAGYSYDWNTGATSQTINASDSGTYIVTVTTPYACESTDSTHIAFLSEPRTEGFNFIPKFFEELGRVDFSPLNPTNVTSYEWDFGDGSPLVTAMSPTHVFAASGEYNVTLKVYNACTDFSSNLQINVDLPTGTATINKDNFSLNIYPNPAKSELNIGNDNPDIQMEHVMIFNTVGAMVYNQIADSKKNHQLSVDSFSPGIYFVRVLTSKGFINKQIHIVK